ncbi:SDR family oxidoreductase [Calditrichota bacterium LG25]
MALNRVLITGINGYISQYLIRSRPQNVEIIGATRGRDLQPLPGVKRLLFLDLTGNVQKQLNTFTEKIDAVIHTAAISSLALCEKEPQLALRVNAQATGEIAAWCKANGVRLIYLSTDIVFKGDRPPYDENSQPQPINQYGYSKWQGEIAVQETLENFAIGRIALALAPGLNGTRNFIDWFFERLNNNETIPLFKDEIRTPTYTVELARRFWRLALSRATGIFHICGAEALDRFTLGQKLCDALGYGHERLKAASLNDMTDYPRPVDVSLISRRAPDGADFKIPSILEFLPLMAGKR